MHWRAEKLQALGCTISQSIPDNFNELIKLPNVGPYAAGAYLSLHRGKRAIIPDANMVRILGRIFGFNTHAETRRESFFLELCELITPKKNFREFNYSIIDLGRLICTPQNPLSDRCFLNDICIYFNKDLKGGKMNLFEEFKKDVPPPSDVALQAIKTKLTHKRNTAKYIKQNFSGLVEDLQIKAYGIYFKAEKAAGCKTIEAALSKRIGQKPTIKSVISEVGSMFAELDRFYLSLTQSRRQRAGSAFETILHVMFKKLGYPFSEQQLINGKTDFLMPHREHYNNNPMDCIIFTCKRSLRERWRQIVTEGTRGLGFFLATIDEKVSADSIEEMKIHRIYLVVPNNTKLKIKSYAKAQNVITFEEFFKHFLDPAVKRWRSRKVI